jgi:hypothetical protein
VGELIVGSLTICENLNTAAGNAGYHVRFVEKSLVGGGYRSRGPDVPTLGNLRGCVAPSGEERSGKSMLTNSNTAPE